MSTTMKVSLLALVASVAAVPQYGHGHSKFHNKPSGPHGTGAGKPYPTGGWPGSFNSTRVPYPTGTGSYDDDKTIDITKTSTTTVYSTVVVKPSPAAPSSGKAVVDNVSSKPVEGQCGPATITVTASEKVTVTVTPGAPSSSAVVQSGGYGASKPEETSTKTPAPSKPVVVSSQAPVPSSKAGEGYPVISSLVNKPVASSAVASSAVASSAVASSAAPKPSSGSGNTYSGGKRGLAYNDASLCKSFGSKFGFGYNWGQVENNDIGTNFIPMMHGPSKSSAEEWLANVDKAVKKGSKAVMGFNEPDHAEQANLTPEAACSAWKTYMNPIAAKYPQVSIIGPSVTNGPASQNMGLSWLKKFYEGCPDAIVHANNIHFYDIYESATIERFQSHVDEAIAINGKPTWVTEFGLNPGSASSTQAASFLKDAMKYLDGNDKVQGYSWFMVGSGENQLNSGSGLSPVGEVYAAGL